jgi:hypothetical protein
MGDAYTPTAKYRLACVAVGIVEGPLSVMKRFMCSRNSRVV